MLFLKLHANSKEADPMVYNSAGQASEPSKPSSQKGLLSEFVGVIVELKAPEIANHSPLLSPILIQG